MTRAKREMLFAVNAISHAFKSHKTARRLPTDLLSAAEAIMLELDLLLGSVLPQRPPVSKPKGRSGGSAANSSGGR